MPLSYKDIEAAALEELRAVNSPQALEAVRLKYVGRSGIITDLISKISTLPPQERPQAGKELNALKIKLQEVVDSTRQLLSTQVSSATPVAVDITLPGAWPELGRIHPLTQVTNEICRIFASLGFQIYESPEMETEYHNFAALNIPLEHPSRDAFDTFYVDMGAAAHSQTSKERLLLRSHTSPGQIRVMKQCRPPVAAIVPGRVYRPDATDASHSCMFHQVEGFLVDRDIKFSDLKGVLEKFCKEMFGPQIKMRFRPHFFPFTEPSAEVDISCIICGAQGGKKQSSSKKACSVCKGKGWLEILGCGMIHPNVFEAVGYTKYGCSGFAFGMGVERIAMLKYGIYDIRIFFENDVRFLRQF